MDKLLGHVVLDDGKLVVAHAGLPEAMHGRASAAVRAFALYGDTTGETDEYGLPVRYPWAEDYRGSATGGLRAHASARGDLGQRHDLHRYRLRLRRQADRASVPGTGACQRGRAEPVYYEPARPLGAPPSQPVSSPAPAERTGRTELSIDDVLGKRIVQTRLTGGSVTIRRGELGRRARGDEQVRRRPALACLPAADHVADRRRRASRACSSTRPRRWPRTVRPGSPRWCARKSTWVRGQWSWPAGTTAAAERRFGTAAAGAIFTRTGRPFFSDPATEAELLARVTRAVSAAGLWTELADRLAGARLRAAALVGQGRRAPAQPVRAGGSGSQSRARGRRRAHSERRGSRAWTPRTCSAA